MHAYSSVDIAEIYQVQSNKFLNLLSLSNSSGNLSAQQCWRQADKFQHHLMYAVKLEVVVEFFWWYDLIIDCSTLASGAFNVTSVDHMLMHFCCLWSVKAAECW